MSRNPKRHPAGDQPFGDMNVGDGPKRGPYTKRSDAQPPVPGRTRAPRVGPCDPTPYADRDTTPRITPELAKGVQTGIPTGEGGGPSADFNSLSYEQRQRRARQGR